MNHISKQFDSLQHYLHSLFDSLPVITEAKSDRDLITQLQTLGNAYGKKIIALFERYQQQQLSLSQVSNQIDAAASMLNPVTEVSQLKRTIAELTKQNTDYESKIEYLNMQLEEITLEMMNTNNHHELEDLRNRLEHEKAIRRDIELQLSKQSQIHSLQSPSSASDGKQNREKQSMILKSHVSELRTAIHSMLQTLFYKLRGQVDSTEHFDSPWREAGLLDEIFLTDDAQLLQMTINTQVQELTQQIKQGSASFEYMINLAQQQQATIEDNIKQQLHRSHIELEQEMLRSEARIKQNQELDELLMEANERDKLRGAELEDFIGYLQTHQEDTLRKIGFCLETLIQMSSSKSIEPNAVKGLYEQIYSLADQDRLNDRLQQLQRQLGVEGKINYSFVQSQSPGKILRKSHQSTALTFKERLKQDQMDLKRQIKSSLQQYEERVQHDEAQLLQHEISKQSQLMDKYEKKNTIIARLHLVVDDGVHQISGLLDSLLQLADSGEAHALLIRVKDQLQLMQQQTSDGGASMLDEEYIRHRQQWISTIAEVKKRSADQEMQMIKEFDALNAANRHFQQIINELEKQKQDANEIHQTQVKELKHKLNQSEDQIEKLHEALENQETYLNQAIEKCRLKDEKLEALARSIGESQRNVEHFQGEVQSTAIENQELRKMLEEVTWTLEHVKAMQTQTTNENVILKNENETYQSELTKIETDVKQMKKSRAQLEQVFERERAHLKRMLEEHQHKLEGQAKVSKQEIAQISNEHQRQLSEQTLKNDELQHQLESQQHEIVSLHSTLKQLEEFSRKQIDLIKMQEEKIAQMHQHNSALTGEQESNEQVFAQLQQKNNSLQQLLKQSADEIVVLRKELERLHQSFAFLQQAQAQSKHQISSLIDTNQSLQSSGKQQNSLFQLKRYQELEERFQKQNEIVQILRDEVRTLKGRLETSKQTLKHKDQEIQNTQQQYAQLQEMVMQLKMKMKELQRVKDFD